MNQHNRVRKQRMAFVLLIACLLAAQIVLPVNVKAQEQKTDGAQDIGSRIEQYVREHADTTAGMSVSVFNGDEVLYENSFGYIDVQNEIPVTEDTVMEWGSVSKLLVWISVMQLVEQGKIDLEADISIYLPENFLQNRAYDTPVTMLNLMNHNAGFEESVVGMATGREERIIPLEEFLRTVQPRQVFEPGAVCAYSNWSTTLAAYIVERVSGIPYDEYVRENIFEPLGMNDSSIRADVSDHPGVKERRMQLKIYTGDVKEITPNMSYIVMYPAGMCISTIGDMRKFAQSLLSEDTVLFQDKETYQELFTPSLYFGETETPRIYHGFWAIESYGENVIGHSGNTAGCSSSLFLDLENHTGMVVLTNQYGEEIYCHRMPELLFGPYEGTASGYTGMVMAARTIFHGPLKLYRLFSVSEFVKEDPPVSFDVRADANGIDRISCPYGDYLVIGFGDIAPDLIVLGLYVLSLAFCLIQIVRCLMMGLVGRIRHKNDKKPMRLWCVAGLLLPFVPAVVFVLMIPTLFNFHQWTHLGYQAALFAVFAAALVMAGMIVSGIVKLRTNTMKKSRKGYIGAVCVCMALTIVNIVYWEWGMFWMI